MHMPASLYCVQDFAFVLEDEAGVMGYTLGVLDTKDFFAWVSHGRAVHLLTDFSW